MDTPVPRPRSFRDSVARAFDTLHLLWSGPPRGGVVEPSPGQFQVGRYFVIDATGPRLRVARLPSVLSGRGRCVARGLDGVLWPRGEEQAIAAAVRKGFAALEVAEYGPGSLVEGEDTTAANAIHAGCDRLEVGLAAIEALNARLDHALLSLSDRCGFTTGFLAVYLGAEWSPAFRALLQTHPQVGFFAAQRIFDEGGFAAVDVTSTVRRLEQGPRQLAAMLGFPDRPASLKLLRRVDVADLGIPVRDLGPLTRIAADERLLEIALAMKDAAFRAFLARGESPAAEVLRYLASLDPTSDEGELARELLDEWRNEEPAALRTLRSVRRFREGPQRFPDDLALPPPPFPTEPGPTGCLGLGTPATLGALRGLGRALGNCLQQPRGVTQILEGTRAIYWVARGDVPVAVFSLVRTSEGGWELEDCLGPGNEPVSPDVQMAVETFRVRHGIGPGSGPRMPETVRRPGPVPDGG